MNLCFLLLVVSLSMVHKVFSFLRSAIKYVCAPKDLQVERRRKLSAEVMRKFGDGQFWPNFFRILFNAYLADLLVFSFGMDLI